MYFPSKEHFVRLARKGNLIPVYRELLADLETPVSAFMKIDNNQYSYLLESVEGHERIARFSFLGSDPSIVIKSKDKRIELIDRTQDPEIRTQHILTEKGPLFEIEKIMSGYKFVPIEGLPRFCGGLVGYLGYDVVRFFENIPQKVYDDLNLPDILFFLSDTLLIFDHIKHKIKVVSCAHIQEKGANKREQIAKAYDRAINKIEHIVSKLKGSIKLKQKKANGMPKMEIKSNFTKRKFENIVRRAKQYIRSGDIIQVVLSQRLWTKISSPPFDIYRALRSINPSPYMYYLKCKLFDLIGSSPESLVRCEDRIVQTRPIAGTRPRGRNEVGDEKLKKSLLGDPKERAEHLMLVDLGRNDLGKVCKFGTVQVPEFMVVERYSHVMHLVSEVVGELKRGNDQFDVLKAAFPAGTVTGAPKIRAMEIIDELEEINRGPYAGAIGYFSFSGNMDACITIRTAIVKDGRAYIQAGAGIVADSKPKNEYYETLNKAKAMLKAIEMAQRGLR